jgi:hypothetical protein
VRPSAAAGPPGLHPKANGKLRPLGIQLLKDRALQCVVKMALEPGWKATFELISFGSRPGRSVHDAAAADVPQAVLVENHGISACSATTISPLQRQ